MKRCSVVLLAVLMLKRALQWSAVSGSFWRHGFRELRMPVGGSQLEFLFHSTGLRTWRAALEETSLLGRRRGGGIWNRLEAAASGR